MARSRHDGRSLIEVGRLHRQLRQTPRVMSVNNVRGNNS